MPDTDPQKPLLTILVVEDNQINQMILAANLHSFGYQPRIVNNGREAIKDLEETSYDVIFMDIQMPIMDGIAATAEIRRKGSHSERPWIIALTASTDQEDRQACLDAGMNDHLTKPVQSQDILRVLSQAYDRLHRPDEASSASGEHIKSVDRLNRSATTSPSTRPSAPLEDQGEVINLKLLLRNCAGRNDFAQKMIQLFLDRFPRDLQEIQAAIQARTLERIVAVAHRMKGTAVTIAADSLRKKADELELSAKQGLPTEEMTTIVDTMQQIVARIGHFKNNLIS